MKYLGTYFTKNDSFFIRNSNVSACPAFYLAALAGGRHRRNPGSQEAWRRRESELQAPQCPAGCPGPDRLWRASRFRHFRARAGGCGGLRGLCSAGSGAAGGFAMNFSEVFKLSNQLCKFSPDGKYLVSGRRAWAEVGPSVGTPGRGAEAAAGPGVQAAGGSAGPGCGQGTRTGGLGAGPGHVPQTGNQAVALGRGPRRGWLWAGDLGRCPPPAPGCPPAPADSGCWR